jgi:hypothetical protein
LHHLLRHLLDDMQEAINRRLPLSRDPPPRAMPQP